MNDKLTETASIPGKKMKAVRRMKQGLADAATGRDAEPPMESLRKEEEDRNR